MRIALMMAVLWGLADCSGDETISAYGAADTEWRLSQLDGQPFTARATLSFTDEGKLSGQAPCNRYFGEQTAPYPWFKAEKIGATRMACTDLGAETVYLEALEAMTLSEVAGDTLILSNDAGREMVFVANFVANGE